ncbi:MAG: MBOAT family protein, partial [Flavobacteriales bacterium]|nr:MBOAT family protein [Flavobacteriales bacterium]
VLDRLFLKKVLDYLPGIVSLGITFFITMVGWVFFRFEDTSEMTQCFQALFSFDFNGNIEVIHSFYPIFILALLFSFICSFSFGKKLERYFFKSTVFSIRGHLFQMVISMSLLILSASYLATSGFNPFIYFRF